MQREWIQEIQKDIHDLDSTDQDYVDDIDLMAKEWITKHIHEEAERIKDQGLKPLVLIPKNYGIVLQDKSIVNRMELDTGFDFNSRIKQILISETSKYPLKENYGYIHLILLTDNMKIPLLIPYLFPLEFHDEEKCKKNTLKEWLFINAKGWRARHSIQEYHSI